MRIQLSETIKRAAAVAAVLAMAGGVAFAASTPAADPHGIRASDTCFKEEGGYHCFAKSARAPASMQCFAEGSMFMCYKPSAKAPAKSIPPSFVCPEAPRDAFACFPEPPIPAPPPPPPQSPTIPPKS